MKTSKELTEYSENALSKKYMVEKSNPLTLVYNIPFTLGEFKILDTYLSRINARDETNKTVRFTIDEYCKLMGVTRMHVSRIEQMLDGMLDKKARFKDANSDEGFVKVALFERSACYKDDSGVWWVELTCTESAKEYIFSIEKMGYTKYYLSETVSLSSIYSYCLYIYILRNRFRIAWTEKLEDLKNEMRCKSETYNEYKYFKSKVLDKAVKEIEEKTSTHFKITPVKEGKNIVALRFQIINTAEDIIRMQDKADGTVYEENKDNEDLWVEAETKYKEDDIQFIAPACKNEFTEAEMEIINDLLKKILPFPRYYNTDHFQYLMLKYHELNKREEDLQKKGEKINNRFAYLKTIIEADIPEKG